MIFPKKLFRQTMKLILTVFLLTVSQFILAQNTESFHFHNGDFLFQDIDCGPLCDAIEKVTPAYKDKHFSHVGLVVVKNDSVWVVEAIGENVHLTTVNDFLKRQSNIIGKPKVVVGRLRKEFEKLNKKAVLFALNQDGVLYDDAFLPNNGKYYCSELIFDAYKFANNGAAIFHLQPMTFKDPNTKKTFPSWKDYYRKINKKIPEGVKGCNPGLLANDNHLQIVFSFY